jgi:small-conductance mechanosensitive channel
MNIDTEVWQNIWQTILVIAIGLVVWLVARSVFRRWGDRIQGKLEDTGELVARARAQRVRTIARTLSTVVLIAALVVVVVTILGIWGVPIGPLVASLSVVGIAIGFGAQDLIKDVIAGMFVLIEDQYAVGDVVKLAGVSGPVEEIRLRTTVLRDLDGSVHHVPNGEARVTTNITYEFSRVVVDLAVAYDVSVDRAMEVVRAIADGLATDPELSESIVEETQILGVEELGESGVVIRVLLTTDPEDRWVIKREFLRRIKNGFDEAGIEIPYPHVTITRPDRRT